MLARDSGEEILCFKGHYGALMTDCTATHVTTLCAALLLSTMCGASEHPIAPTSELLKLQQIEVVQPCTYGTISIQNKNLTPLIDALECIYNDYSELKYSKDETTKKLLVLDNDIQNLVKSTLVLEPGNLWLAIWDDKYGKIGLYIEDGFQYTGQLKNEAGGIPSLPPLPLSQRLGGLTEFEKEKYFEFEKMLARIYDEYTALPKIPESTKTLYALDNELRKFVMQAQKPNARKPALVAIAGRYLNLGLHHADTVRYTGKIMLEADKLLFPYVPIDERTEKYRAVPGEKFTFFKDSLERIYAEYIALPMKPDDAEKLYLLHQKLPKIISALVEYYPFHASQVFWDEKYVKVGLGIGHYSDQLDYSGKLIIDAHKANPNSRYREETLLAAIGDDNSDVIKELYAYLQEFPNGKYAVNIYSDLADFYHGLYKYLRYKPEADQAPYISEIKDKCYKPYISERPVKDQLAEAKRKGISFYKKVIAQTPQAKLRNVYMEELAALENGVNQERDAWCDVMD